MCLSCKEASTPLLWVPPPPLSTRGPQPGPCAIQAKARQRRFYNADEATRCRRRSASVVLGTHHRMSTEVLRSSCRRKMIRADVDRLQVGTHCCPTPTPEYGGLLARRSHPESAASVARSLSSSPIYCSQCDGGDDGW